ncbi:hypothetical protein CEXT_775401 [Caerostris extrusa]|uniref:Uncharacterized protein n=1 Tax=Caerostris extrusa TaxID=172846 RepID=A0AAV4MN59_CAEEX|nr:hypothetical protein CEXT_775401 [Caerostris extrusa]
MILRNAGQKRDIAVNNVTEKSSWQVAAIKITISLYPTKSSQKFHDRSGGAVNRLQPSRLLFPIITCLIPFFQHDTEKESRTRTKKEPISSCASASIETKHAPLPIICPHSLILGSRPRDVGSRN